MKQLSWKAVRRGATYCSPGCGAKCTWEKYQHAKRMARALAKRLGPGWKPEVWENMGWHWKAAGPGGALVYDQGIYGGGPHYWCSIPPGVVQFQGVGKTPEAAFRRARKAVERAAKALAGLSAVLGGAGG